jgi:uncharacterized membrane protein YdjX (TVP38/TMEM64 family)
MQLPRVFASKHGRRRTLVYLALFAAAWIAAALVVDHYVPGLADPGRIRTYVLEFGPLAPVAFVALQAGQVVLAPIPGQVVALAGGYLFGTVAGTAYSVVGATVGSYVAFSLARRYGREYVERVLDADLLDRFDAVAGEWGLLSLFVAFLLPGLPDDAICFVAGCTTLDLRKMVVVSMVGRTPTYFLTNLAGDRFAAGEWGVALAVVAVLLAASAVGYWKRAEIVARLKGTDRSAGAEDGRDPEAGPGPDGNGE